MVRRDRKRPNKPRHKGNGSQHKGRSRYSRGNGQGRGTDREGHNCYQPPNLHLGVSYDGEAKLREIIERELPEFAKCVQTDAAAMMILHQDAFASGYDTVEYILFGMALKYAGLYGKRVVVIGDNGDTC